MKNILLLMMIGCSSGKNENTDTEKPKQLPENSSNSVVSSPNLSTANSSEETEESNIPQNISKNSAKIDGEMSKREIVEIFDEILEKYPSIYSDILNTKGKSNRHGDYYKDLLSILILNYVNGENSYTIGIPNVYSKSLQIINGESNVDAEEDISYIYNEDIYTFSNELWDKISSLMVEKKLNKYFVENKLFIKAMIARIGFSSVPSSHKLEENKKLYAEIIEHAADEYIREYQKNHSL